MIVVRRDLEDMIIINHKTNLIYHLYFMLLEFCELDQQSKNSARKTTVVNVYDNQVGRVYI